MWSIRHTRHAASLQATGGLGGGDEDGDGMIVAYGVDVVDVVLRLFDAGCLCLLE